MANFLGFIVAIVLIVFFINKLKKLKNLENTKKISIDSFLNKLKADNKNHYESIYERKMYLFDVNSEFQLFKILLELFGDKYFIFPQINYSHLIKPKKSSWVQESIYRSSIDRKSADFVLCEKEKAIPILVIELDGSSHYSQKKVKRDKFINGVADAVGMPILHIETRFLNKEFVQAAVEDKLGSLASSSKI